MSVQFKPERYHSVTPYLVQTDAGRLIEFLKSAFDATEIECMRGPDGRVAHAEVKIGDSVVMVGEKHDNSPAMHAMLYLYVEDTDALYHRALKAGGRSVREPADMFYGDRNAAVEDPCGHQWWLATHKEDVYGEELQRRAAAQKS